MPTCNQRPLDLFPRAWAEVDLDRLAANALNIARHVGGLERILATVKGDAYGHGAAEVSRRLHAIGVRRFGVATVEEGTELREAGVDGEILVLSPVLPEEVVAASAVDLSLTAGSLEFARAAHQVGEEMAFPCPLALHVGVDTGMGREGAMPADVSPIVARIRDSDHLRLAGLFTHFPSADDGRRAFTRRQIRQFSTLVERLGTEAAGVPRHAANSAAVLDYAESHLDFVRPGLLLYGIYPGPNVARAVEVSPVLSFWSRVIHLKSLPERHPVSYGRSFYTARDTRIASIGVGYGDGFFRAFSRGLGAVGVRGRRYEVCGNVTMDQVLIALGEEEAVEVGDPVLVLGEDAGLLLDADDLARALGTIPWEVLTAIGPRVPRVYVENGEPRRMRTLRGLRVMDGSAWVDPLATTNGENA